MDALARLLADPPDLPVAGGLGRLRAALGESGSAVVTAPPGSGKTTLVPPAVALDVPGRVVVTQPRRIAARAAARRLASLLGERVGETVGFSVRGERAVSPATRIEVVTTGLLLRRLQADPTLDGVDAVVLDEVHERALDADLALALLLDARAALREDLRLVAMSATLSADRFAALLDAPVVDVPGSLHPVEVRWAPPAPGVLPVDERGVPPTFLAHVAATVRTALAEHEGDVLVFVPGAREVDRVCSALAGCGADVLPLHGRLPASAQDDALSPRPGRRVVVSTAVAESSLTVPGVRVVVDAGLAREPRHDPARGLGGLVTVRVSRAGAEQRGGRAGREAPGTVLRCWSQAEHAHLAAHPLPEIAVADLVGFALETAAWGTPGGVGLALPDAPPAAALASATSTLTDLGALEETGGLTARGRSLVGLPVDPRLGRALLDGAPLVGARRAAEVVALVAEDRTPDGDLVAALRSVRRERPRSWTETVRRLLPSVGDAPEPRETLTDDLAVGAVVALAHPDRVARRRTGSAGHLLVGGTGCDVPGALAELEWLAVADVDRRPGQARARVRSAAPLTEELALVAAAARRTTEDEVTWREGRLRARRVTRLGAIELSATALAQPSSTAVTAAVREALARDGLDVLPWTDSARALRHRLAFLHRELGAPWPDVSDEALADGLDDWLDVSRVRSGKDLARLDVLSGLRGLLPWPEATRLDELAPERLPVPSGATHRVDYADASGQPVVACKLQECFGLAETPRLADGRAPVLLHLLSPAGRPLAVTADLASFWAGPYAGVRAEMRGRYPKHPWPEDPWSAQATARTSRR
ncbi:ATP-dependent helicase HrpB [Nocardioides bruguierae]|uniref:ATP-dependent helicase HrpB n=1 Tax=Nocardioides bruguierae TaxID=2945102 RepID=A0A9X2D3S0_9ACTN|nr:ATP-dependent helicase HrpB [Nocardioides bruguierae]MCM0618678.1 ATP-dependent helicase HrpB [Nocardioides bruguierae]